ncbi:proline-rich protein HaeIII subfamily 1-like [Etheostoma spectabile]|uniref:proline-rich protein HaeIII subfamily 1-like n=1 Tax=Etheostoma spectabile TaxID=54343 RepID=UPI0013AF4900|nr:proline-rich protein HaeIII subfamily 1-like [Etheostoma spectabile]
MGTWLFVLEPMHRSLGRKLTGFNPPGSVGTVQAFAIPCSRLGHEAPRHPSRFFPPDGAAPFPQGPHRGPAGTPPGFPPDGTPAVSGRGNPRLARDGTQPAAPPRAGPRHRFGTRRTQPGPQRAAPQPPPPPKGEPPRKADAQGGAINPLNPPAPAPGPTSRHRTQPTGPGPKPNRRWPSPPADFQRRDTQGPNWALPSPGRPGPPPSLDPAPAGQARPRPVSGTQPTGHGPRPGGPPPLFSQSGPPTPPTGPPSRPPPRRGRPPTPTRPALPRRRRGPSLRPPKGFGPRVSAAPPPQLGGRPPRALAPGVSWSRFQGSSGLSPLASSGPGQSQVSGTRPPCLCFLA